ncbi:chromate transporter [Gemmobacter megaterium]|uniref:Chromate transporter n=1 Tax=Gemmobacter megaterium TaxID=1086013 RepID=A0A1N7KHU3_9RHOB|nr:chromate efflux transporter [Gemmobacter megaterium]GGE02235.1 chromate transporter [Gemmobacter megaterium]SIS61117.1 chromate transporter [Gemmobacter megaterium]
MTLPDPPPPPPDRRAHLAEVAGVFLRLGLTSFGGPIAHLGYFRQEFVVRRGWLDDRAYADLVALCQFLPGPASSQVGFALGLMRAGWQGALAAFVAFTLPSALLMAALALGAGWAGGAVGAGAIHGLKIVAVAVVAQAVRGMARQLCPDGARATIALTALVWLALLPGTPGMIGAIVTGAVAGLALGRGKPGETGTLPAFPVTRGQGVAALILLGLLLAGLPLVAPYAGWLALSDSFARAGALVFGGGHVVLPLLEAGVVQTGQVAPDAFLAGYAAAQAMPGPLFTFAAYLGALADGGPQGIAGAALATVAIFVPGFLLLIAALPFWLRFRSIPAAQSLMQGANAAVVGVLAAALYDPIFTGTVRGLADLAAVGACLLALDTARLPPWSVVLAAAALGAMLRLLVSF